MTGDPQSVEARLAELKDVAPGGYALAFHIRFTAPAYLFQTYPAEWLSHYNQNGLVMKDPTVHWAFENEGYRRWSDLAAMDDAGVLKQAAEHGLSFGLTWALELDDSRSIGSFARNDREFTGAEAETLYAHARGLHLATRDLDRLPKGTAAELDRLAVTVTQTADG